MATKKQAEIIEQMKQKITELEVERKERELKNIRSLLFISSYDRDKLTYEGP